MLVLWSKTHVPGDLGLKLSYPSALTFFSIAMSVILMNFHKFSKLFALKMI